MTNEERNPQPPMVETRSAIVGNVDWGQRIITVIAVPYEQPAQVPFRSEVWNEVFSRSAFSGIESRVGNAASRRIPVVAALKVPDREHDGRIVGKVVGADPNHPEGLVTEVYVSRTPLGDDTLTLANDDALSASVGYMVKDPYRDQALDRRSKVRRINRAFLDHLAFVGVPAFSGARVLSVRGEGNGEAALPPARPLVDQFADDPIFRWASDRVRKS